MIDDDVIRVQKRMSALEIARMKRSYKSRLLFALQDMPPPPCTTCAYWQRCADESLACEMFKQYVADKPGRKTPSKEPTAEIYSEIYGDDE